MGHCNSTELSDDSDTTDTTAQQHKCKTLTDKPLTDKRLKDKPLTDAKKDDNNKSNKDEFVECIFNGNIINLPSISTGVYGSYNIKSPAQCLLELGQNISADMNSKSSNLPKKKKAKEKIKKSSNKSKKKAKGKIKKSISAKAARQMRQNKIKITKSWSHRLNCRIKLRDYAKEKRAQRYQTVKAKQQRQNRYHTSKATQKRKERDNQINEKYIQQLQSLLNNNNDESINNTIKSNNLSTTSHTLSIHLIDSLIQTFEVEENVEKNIVGNFEQSHSSLNKNNNNPKVQPNDTTLSGGSMQIFVKTVSGKPITLNVVPNETILNVKVKIAANLREHQSWHFGTKIEKTYDNGKKYVEYHMLNSVTPKHKFVDADGELKFEAIPKNEQKPLSHDTCMICCSSNHKHSFKSGQPFSECFLFSPYKIGPALKVSKSAPSTNVSVACKLCKMLVYKYLMREHYKEIHPNCLLPEEHIIPMTEIKALVDALENSKTQNDKITQKWNPLIERKTKDKPSKSQMKASKKYSITKTKTSNNTSNRKRTFNAMNTTSNENNKSNRNNKSYRHNKLNRKRSFNGMNITSNKNNTSNTNNASDTNTFNGMNITSSKNNTSNTNNASNTNTFNGLNITSNRKRPFNAMNTTSNENNSSINTNNASNTNDKSNKRCRTD